MDNFQKFYDRALRFLSYRPRSEKEIRDFFLRHSGKRSASRIDSGQVFRPRAQDRGARMTIIDQVINKLKEQNFINDEEFTKWWIEQRQGSRPRGIRVIKMELKQKGISDELITNYQLLITNQLELAKKALEKKAGSYRSLSREKTYRKLSQFLLRRGFDWETVKDVIDEVLKKEYNIHGEVDI